MLTPAQFDKLRVGDVVLYNGRPRTVRMLSRKKTRWGLIRRLIGFSILRRSWTGRIYTLYGYHDVKHALSLPRKERDRREVCRAEEDALLASGFDVAAQVDRELREHERLEKLGMGERKDAVRLMKHVKRKLKRRKG